MKRATKIVIGVGTVLTLGLAAVVVSAHPYGYGPGWGMGQGHGYGPVAAMGQGFGPGYGPGAGMGRGMGPQAFGNPSAMADARNAYLKNELNITPAQESAWKTFFDDAKEQAEVMQKLMTSMQGGAPATAPERMELRNQIMKQRQEQMEKTAAAFKAFYAVLTPEQRALADQRVGMMGGRGTAFNKPGK